MREKLFLEPFKEWREGLFIWIWAELLDIWLTKNKFLEKDLNKEKEFAHIYTK